MTVALTAAAALAVILAADLVIAALLTRSGLIRERAEFERARLRADSAATLSQSRHPDRAFPAAVSDRSGDTSALTNSSKHAEPNA